jgi:hypothetical protein
VGLLLLQVPALPLRLVTIDRPSAHQTKVSGQATRCRLCCSGFLGAHAFALFLSGCFRSVRYPEILDGFSGDYLYLDSIRFILSVKTCSFAEHSPMLNDITIIKTCTNERHNNSQRGIMLSSHADPVVERSFLSVSQGIKSMPAYGACTWLRYWVSSQSSNTSSTRPCCRNGPCSHSQVRHEQAGETQRCELRSSIALID